MVYTASAGQSTNTYDVDENAGYKVLAYAIIRQAISDYKLCMKVLKSDDPKLECLADRALIEQKRLEDFFLSQWFMLLNESGYTGEDIIRRLQEEEEVRV